ncbi:MAG: ATP synthase F1 subunit epsilon [Deltaproteobacteria bacterium]|nr:ATP synthase F1 subunit epsilon [Deltaproteobacteria bacterium]MBW2253981.1 ATP synthase F1 subunit epsilon [Deltaproteobacteria bacterium]
MADLTVTIVTPEREVYAGQSTEILLPGWEGEFDILPGHDLFLSLLRGGVLDMTTPEGHQRYIVGRGFAEASAEQVTVLVDSCEPAEGIDTAAAKADLAAADNELLESASGTPEWEAAVEQRELAMARLKV